jgi:hypothetical protein
METLITDIAELRYDETTSILHVKILEDVHMDMEKTVSHCKLVKRITRGEKYMALVDATNYFTTDEDALKYLALPETTKGRVAMAFHSLNLANRLTIHFFRLLYKPNFTIHLFRVHEDALEWLRLEQQNSLAS